MLFMTTYTWEPGQRNDLLKRRMEKGIANREGVKVLGEWTDLCGGRGFMLIESNDPQALITATMRWSDLMQIEAVPVIVTEDLITVAKQDKSSKK
jgi:hypothetical protein